MKKIGFTLAEVLIVLGIIGIIAELTIPVLMNNVELQTQKVALRKSYSNFSQATMTMLSENGNSLAGLCNAGSSSANSDCFGALFAQYLRVTKTCPTSASGCFHDEFKLLNNNSAQSSWGWGPDYSMVLNDGMLVDIYLPYPNCDQPVWGTVNECGYLAVDVNGLKKPNTLGKDIYFFHIEPDGLKPFGQNSSDKSLGGGHPLISGDCASTREGVSCAYVNLYQ